MKPRTPFYPENPPVAGSKGLPRAAILPAAGSKGAPPPVAPLTSHGLGNPACAPLHFASGITAPSAPVIAFLFNTNAAPPKKLTCSKHSRKHFLFDTFARFSPRPAAAAVAAIFTRPTAPKRTIRMFLINVPSIRNVRNSLKTNNGGQF
jgi:hypothetical protein